MLIEMLEDYRLGKGVITKGTELEFTTLAIFIKQNMDWSKPLDIPIPHWKKLE